MKKLNLLLYTVLFILIAISLNACTSSASQNDSQENTPYLTATQKLDELIGTYAEYDKFNGSVLVAREGEVIYKNGFGMANMEWEISNQPDTKHRLASITKQFTAMLILQLVAEGKLALDIPISTYLPDYPKDKGSIITLHHLLTHSSGIPNYTANSHFYKQEYAPFRPEEIVALFADSSLHFKPGERFEYSNSGYVLLGVIIEKITGESYEEVLQKQILDPLGMKNTGYDHNQTILKHRASGYQKAFGTFQHAKYVDMSTPFSAGALYSTVEDLYIWDQGLYSEKLLPSTYKDLLFKAHIPDYNQHYGYGWDVGDLRVGSTKDYVETISHSGGIRGFSTYLIRIPSSKSLIVLLNNTGRAPLYEMAIAINGIIYDKSYDFPKKSIAHGFLDLIKKESLESARKFYEEMKDSDDHYLNENEMNLAGYELLEGGRLEEAASIFELNIEAFPKSFNVYDSYGEVMMKLGKKAEAIQNYKKSLELNPNNENGKKMLKELEE